MRTDPNPDTSYLDESYNEDRRSAYMNGHFDYCGIVCEVYCLNQRIASSAGLWGIETDSDDEYIAAVAEDEIAAALLDSDRYLQDPVNLAKLTSKAFLYSECS
jgi:hypothetical protein